MALLPETCKQVRFLTLLTIRLINCQFLLDSKCRIPDPGSSPELTTTDPRTGRLASILYVPLELPQSSTKPLPLPPHVYRSPGATASASAPDDRGNGISSVGVTGSSVFGDRRSDGGKTYEESRKVPARSRTNSAVESTWNAGSLKGRIRASSVRHVSSLFLGGESDTSTPEETSTKRKWSLVKKTSGFFRSRSKVKTDDGDKAPQVANHKEVGVRETVSIGFRGNILSNKKVSVPSEPEHNVTDIVGYLRERASSDLVYDISRRSQPARAYYHSPAVINTHGSITEPRLQMPRSISDASKKSIETTATTDTYPSLSHSLTSSYSCNDESNYTSSPRANSTFSPEESCSSESEDDDDTYEVETPIDGLGITTPYQSSERTYPKYYNFDEISVVPGGNRDIGKYSGDVILSEAPYAGIPGGPKPLACLREEVAGELAWREELVDELGYLGGVVV